MKAKTMVALTAVLVAFNSFGSVLLQGTKEVGIRGRFDPEGAAGQELDGELTLGVMAADDFEVGLLAGISRNDVVQRWNAGVFCEYNFDLGGRVVPFIGVAACFTSAKVDEEEVDVAAEPDPGESDADPAVNDTADDEAAADAVAAESTSDDTQEQSTAPETGRNRSEKKTEAVVLTVKGGLKWFLTSSIAVETALASSWATEEIFVRDDEPSPRDLQVQVGLRVFF